MLGFLAWALRVGAAVLGVAAGVALYAAAPEDGRAPPTATEAECAFARAMLALEQIQQPPRPDLETLRGRAARCPPPRRTTWDAAGRDRGLMLAGGAIGALIISALLASAARREGSAAEMLAEARRRHD